MTTPFVSFSNDELGPNLPNEIQCPHCNQTHPISCSSENPKNNHATSTLQFYKCGDKVYLAGINGQRVPAPKPKTGDED